MSGSQPEDDRLAIEIDPLLFRRALGSFATGVVVVTSLDDEVPRGMAVNSFASVSLDPPLISFCAARSSTTWPLLRRSPTFAVNVLTAEQEDLCRTFARSGADRFAGLGWTEDAGGPPLLDGALAHLVCSYYAVHEAGDHELILGRVISLQQREDGEPLVFYRGGYTRLESRP